MIPSFDSEVRACLAGALGSALGADVDARRICLPARHADASVYLPRGSDPARALGADCGALWGAPLVSGVCAVNGWLLFTFSDAFFTALIERINAALPPPRHDGGSHAVNRMLVLARHGGEGCPPIPAMRRALLEGICAGRSPAAFDRAARAAETLFHSIPPRERPALLDQSGALGGALARLLANVL